MDVSALGGLLTIALAVMTIATLAGASWQRGRVADLRDQLKDEREAHDADEKEAARAEARHLKFKAEAETKIAEIESDLAALRRVVTGEVHLVALADRVEDLITLISALIKLVESHFEDGEP